MPDKEESKGGSSAKVNSATRLDRIKRPGLPRQIPFLIEMATVIRTPKDALIWPIILALRNIFGRCEATDEDGKQCIFQQGHFPLKKHLAIIPHGSSFKVFGR